MSNIELAILSIVRGSGPLKLMALRDRVSDWFELKREERLPVETIKTVALQLVKDDRLILHKIGNGYLFKNKRNT